MKACCFSASAWFQVQRVLVAGQGDEQRTDCTWNQADAEKQQAFIDE